MKDYIILLSAVLVDLLAVILFLILKYSYNIRSEYILYCLLPLFSMSGFLLYIEGRKITDNFNSVIVNTLSNIQIKTKQYREEVNSDDKNEVL